MGRLLVHFISKIIQSAAHNLVSQEDIDRYIKEVAST